MQQSMQEASQIAKPQGGELVTQDAGEELPQESPGTRRRLADKDGGAAETTPYDPTQEDLLLVGDLRKQAVLNFEISRQQRDPRRRCRQLLDQALRLVSIS